ncbi:hypothetical protein CJ030_MR1G005713 [Morella rubra]|uniref:Uncharacterized protein n=1 Tax=Morella rubra TaxID=262757 RepID=A0A6A1WSL8_9ROSI|nr:hypothetical protein CJ030_MR1G005713 [Morella rubra]
MAVPEEVHGEIVSGGSVTEWRRSVAPPRPPEAVAYDRAHGGASSKESACHKEHFGVTTLQGGGVAGAEEHGGGHHWRQSNVI